MAKQRILVVAHDAGLRATLARWLIAAGYSVELAESAKHARRVLANERIGLAIAAPDELDRSDLAFELREEDALARIDAVLRTETDAAEAAPELLHFAGYTLDAIARSCLDASGRVVALTRAELALLLSLARRPGRAVSRDELTRAVAG